MRQTHSCRAHARFPLHGQPFRAPRVRSERGWVGDAAPKLGAKRTGVSGMEQEQHTVTRSEPKSELLAGAGFVVCSRRRRQVIKSAAASAVVTMSRVLVQTHTRA